MNQQKAYAIGYPFALRFKSAEKNTIGVRCRFPKIIVGLFFTALSTKSSDAFSMISELFKLRFLSPLRQRLLVFFKHACIAEGFLGRQWIVPGPL